MGLFDALTKQFIDVLQWQEDAAGVLSWRFPAADAEIQSGASLTVRESQVAVFVDEGQIADVFGPGQYTLNTSTLPVLTALRNWDKLFESPFKSDVYFFSTRDQLDRRWGTAQPITFRDKDYGAIRMWAFGQYSYRLVDPELFHTKVSGTESRYTVDDLDGQLRGIILSSITSFLASSGVPFLDMAGNLTVFSAELLKALTPVFAEYGLQLASFHVKSVSLPPELQEALDKATKVRMAGNLQRLTQYQVAEAIPTAAANSGGLAGAGAGLGAGMAMGSAMGGAMGNAMGGAGGGGGADPADAAFAKLEKLHELLTKGVITQAEFDAKKAELLADI